MQTDEGKKTESNYNKCKTSDKKGVDRVHNVQQDFALTHQERVQAVILTRTKAEARIKKGKGTEGAYPQTGFSASEIPLKRDKVIPNKAIGILIALTIHQRLRGTIQDTLLGWLQFLWNLPTIRRTLFWILVAHDRLDQERQSEGPEKRVVLWYCDRLLSLQYVFCVCQL